MRCRIDKPDYHKLVPSCSILNLLQHRAFKLWECQLPCIGPIWLLGYSPTPRFCTTNSSSSSLMCLQTSPLNQMAQKAKFCCKGLWPYDLVRKMVHPAGSFSCRSQVVFQCPLCRLGTSCWWLATDPHTLGEIDAYTVNACKRRITRLLGAMHGCTSRRLEGKKKDNEKNLEGDVDTDPVT